MWSESEWISNPCVLLFAASLATTYLEMIIWHILVHRGNSSQNGLICWRSYPSSALDLGNSQSESWNVQEKFVGHCQNALKHLKTSLSQIKHLTMDLSTKHVPGPPNSSFDTVIPFSKIFVNSKNTVTRYLEYLELPKWYTSIKNKQTQKEAGRSFLTWIGKFVAFGAMFCSKNVIGSAKTLKQLKMTESSDFIFELLTFEKFPWQTLTTLHLHLEVCSWILPPKGMWDYAP